MKITTVKRLLAVTVLIALLILAFSACNKPEDEEPKEVTLGESGAFGYTVVYGTNNNLGSRWATGVFKNFVYQKFGVDIRPVNDSTSEVANEVLIGDTNRQLSRDLKEAAMAGHTADDDVWGFGYRDGKLAVYANSQSAFDRAMAQLEADYLKDGKLVIPTDLWTFDVFTKAEKDEIANAENEAVRQKRLEAAKAANAAFKQEQFGGLPKKMIPDGEKSPYAAPLASPTKGEHPRVFVTKSDIPYIKEILAKPENQQMFINFWKRANTTDFTGVLEDQVKDGVTIRWNTYYFEIVEAKALAYVLTGDEVYAYEAIVGIKNMMLTLKYDAVIHSDTYHGADEILTHTAMVYDMCNDKLTEDDKNQLLGGLCNLMWPQLEFSFPPKNLSAVSGHGTGSQFIRTQVALALAVCDDMPDWWEFVGGRYYQEYLPVINYCYEGGFVSQGTSNYGDLKLQVNFLSAFYVKNATGKMPLTENARLAPYFMISHIMPNGNYFQTGDGGRSGTGSSVTPHFIILGAKLFNDPTLAAWGKYLSNNYTEGYAHRYSRTISYSNMLTWLARAPEPVEDLTKTTKLIQYLGYPSGLLSARSSWDSDAAHVLMRVGGITMTNHDSNDAGTFHIYYKGLLACTAGSYSHYGANHHKYYLRDTVGQNSLLVYNPALGTDTPVYGTTTDGNGNTVDNVLDVKNGDKYFYTGGQLNRGSAGDYDNWTSGKFDVAEVVAVDEKYVSGAAKYAYINGDITKAYSTDTVDFAGRRMLTVFTGDEEFPMIFLTFDTVTSTDASFRKSFLLHTVKEPTIDKTGKTASIVNGDGRLNLVSLYGPDFIEKIGGEGYAYWISGSTFYNEDGTLNGKNCLDTYVKKDNYDKIWGRVELVKEGGNLTDNFLTAMYVTDAENTKTLATEKFNEGKVWGVKIKNVISAFVEGNVANYKEVSFTTEGSGNFEYYVSGLEAGTWDIYVDGAKATSAKVAKGSDLLYFTAKCGAVRIVPTDDVEGVAGGKIVYETYGGTLPDGAPTKYKNDTATTLPTAVTRDTDVFLGWYTSSKFEESSKVTEVPVGTEGTFKVYALYKSVFFDFDYDNATTDVNAQESTATADGIRYAGSSKAGSSFIIKTDEHGEKYLEWKKGQSDPNMSITSTEKNFSMMSVDGDECVSFTLTFARDGENAVTNMDLRIMSTKTYTTDGKTGKLVFATVFQDGKIKLADGTEIAELTAGVKVTVRAVVDFKNATVTAYNADGTVIATSALTIPSNSIATSLSEYRTQCTEHMLYPYSPSKTSEERVIRIYDMRFEEGNAFAK